MRTYCAEVESAPVSIAVATGTLITPQHVVLASHFPISNGTILQFTDRNGNAVVRRLVRQDFAWFDTMKVSTDMAGVRLVGYTCA